MFISSYSREMEFIKQLHSSLPQNCEFIFSYNYGKEEKSGKDLFDSFGNPSILMVRPKKGEMYTNVHSKLWLIAYKSFLRVVVTSANFTAIDFACWSQSFWVQDFPLKRSDQIGKTCEFEEILLFHYSRLSCDSDSSWIKAFDFQESKAFLVSSVPINSKLTAMNDITIQGQGRLRNILKGDDNMSDEVYYLSSTIGKLYQRWFGDMKNALNTKKIKIIFSGIGIPR